MCEPLSKMEFYHLWTSHLVIRTRVHVRSRVVISDAREVVHGSVRRSNVRINKSLHSVCHDVQIVVGIRQLFVSVLEEIVLQMTIKRCD